MVSYHPLIDLIYQDEGDVSGWMMLSDDCLDDLYESIKRSGNADVILSQIASQHNNNILLLLQKMKLCSIRLDEYSDYDDPDILLDAVLND